MQIRLHLDDSVAQAKLAALAQLIPDRLRETAAQALREEAALLTPLVRANIASALNVRKRSFVTSVKVKIYDKKASKLPALWVGSKVPWLGVHDRGATITGIRSGRLVIPFVRQSYKRFQSLMRDLINQGNIFFMHGKDGHVYIMAENIRESDRSLGGFKRSYRKREGIKRLKRGQDIPIAVIVRSVRIKKRTDIKGIVAQRVPAIGARIIRTLKLA